MIGRVIPDRLQSPVTRALKSWETILIAVLIAVCITNSFLSPFFLNMLPYLFTILVLVLSTREATRRALSAPASLGRSYTREDRG